MGRKRPIPHLLLLLLLLFPLANCRRQLWLHKLRAGAADLRLRRASWTTTTTSPTTFSLTGTTTQPSSHSSSSPQHNSNTHIHPASDLRRPGRSFHIVTTAALPWCTGTAVNPLLRAAHLCQHNNATTTLVVPWLERPDDQALLYGTAFASPAAQEEYLREWLRTTAQLPEAAERLRLRWYPARYHAGLGSVFGMGDIWKCLGEGEEEDELDVCILEEPEHWYVACWLVGCCGGMLGRLEEVVVCRG